VTTQADLWRERDLDEHVRGLAKLYGLAAYHTHDSRQSPAGFPDWVIAGPRGVLFRENKRQNGTPTPAQLTWARVLLAAGADYEVWRPADALDGRIKAQLARLRGDRHGVAG
jgi:hypothetical protein